MCTSPLEGERRGRKAGENRSNRILRRGKKGVCDIWEKWGWASEEFQKLGVGVGESEQVPKGGVQQVPKGGVQQAPAGEHAAGRPCVLACKPCGCGWTRARVERWLSSRMAERARNRPAMPQPSCTGGSASSGLRTARAQQRLAHCLRPRCALGAPSVRPRCRHTHTHLGRVTWRQLASRTQKLGAASAASVSSSAAASADPATGAKHVASALDVPASMPREAPKLTRSSVSSHQASLYV